MPTLQGQLTDAAGSSRKNYFEWIGLAIDSTRRRVVHVLSALRHPFASRFSASLSITRLSDRLAVEARGLRDGASERPPSLQEELTGTQSEIVHFCKELQRKANRRVNRLSERLRARDQAIDLAALARGLRDLPDKCRNDVLRTISGFRTELHFLQERENQQRAHYDAFQEQNKLTRIARYPTHPVILFAFVIALIPICAYLLDAVSLSISGSNRLLPSNVALIASAMGVLVPFAVGAGYFRGINHVQAAERFAAWLAVCLTLVFVLSLAYFFAVYMDRLSVDPDVTVDGVLASIGADPFRAASDLVAWEAAGIIGLAALLAFFIGYRTDDPYPGYGAAQRAYYRARSEHERKMQALQRRLNNIVDAAEREIRVRTKRAKSRIKSFGRLVEKARSMHDDLAGFDSALEDSCNILLDRYREANMSARKTEVPLSFSEHVCFRADNDNTAAMVRHGESRLEALEREHAELEAEGDGVRQKLRELNQRGLLDIESRVWGGDDI